MVDVIDAALNPPLRDRQHAAYLRLLPRAQQMGLVPLLPINVDPGYVISVGLATASRIRQFRDLVATLAPHLDLAELDSLEDLALAFSYSHGEYMFASTAPEELPALREEGARIRDRLLNNGVSLSQFGLLPNERLTGLKGPVAYHGLAQDLTALSKVFKDYWPAISTKTPVTIEEVERASELALQLYHDTGIREHAPARDSEAALIRQRFFTLLVRCYEQVQRAVVFLRWNEGDADIIAPSLYGNRARRGRAEETPVGPPVPPAGDITLPVEGDDDATAAEAPAGNAPAGHRAVTPPSFADE